MRLRLLQVDASLLTEGRDAYVLHLFYLPEEAMVGLDFDLIPLYLTMIEEIFRQILRIETTMYLTFFVYKKKTMVMSGKFQITKSYW